MTINAAIDPLANTLVQELLNFRAEYGSQQLCNTKNCGCKTNLLEQLMPNLIAGKKIQFVLPGFAAKSANRDKTLGPLPDLGEHLALQRLNNLCIKLAAIYSPGVELIICADGHVFNDLVGVSETDLRLYSENLHQLIKTFANNHLQVFDLTQAYPETSLFKQRERLVAEFGNTVDNIRANIRNNVAERELFNGIHRFVVEDQKVLHNFSSLSQLRNHCKNLAYQVILRSHAWSELIAARYPNSVRFSIHPYPCGAKKFGLQLLPSKNSWATPWHNVVLEQAGKYQLMKRCEAVALGATMAVVGGQPSHYVL